MDIPSAQRSQKRISFWAFSLISLLLYTLIAMHFSFFKKMMLLNFLHLSFQRMAIKYCQFAFGKLLLIVLFLSDRWSSQSAEASPPGITFDDVSSEDYSSVLGEQEPTKPDDVDNEVIQSLVDNFLNRGSVSGGNDADGGAKASAEPAKLNKEAQALVNSSDYWRIDNLKSMHSISDPDEVRKWLNGYSAELQKILQQIALAGWNYFTSASYSTKQYLDEAEEVGRTFLRATAKQSGQFNASAFPYGSAERLQLSVLAQQGMNALDSVDLQEFNRILLAINQQFTHTQLCGEPGKAPMGGDKTACLLKFTDIPALLDAPSADATQCLELWQKWRLAAGQNLSASYAQLVHLSNKGARLNGFADTGAMWRAVYELPGEQYGFQPGRQLDMVQQLDLLFAQLRPLYEQLHAYFRSRLAALHSKKGNEENQKAGMISRDGALPIHLLKSQNGDNWASYYEQSRPFSEEATMEEQKIPNQMLDSFHAQNYTVRIMFSKVYRFMKYLGFERLPRTFWTNSIFTRNWAKDMICNPATAYDMMNGYDDYRIKVCGQLSEADFVNAHRLMAKLYYQYSSRQQPILLRDAPNPSLSSAMAGAFGIIALNPDYLRAQRLIGEQVERSGPAEINRLYKEALEEVVKLPFAIVADKWRYAVFEGRLSAGNWSEEWWRLRQKYQGVKAPSMANPLAAEFDPVASPAITQMHAPAARDALAYVAQFQVLKKLCGGINQISQGCLPTKNALESVRDAISKGGSISWLDAFEKLTGSRQLDAGPLLEYYEPLLEWLKNTNENEQRVIGWESGKDEPFQENELPELHGEYQNDSGAQFGTGLMGISSEDGGNIAFPGQSCEKGQECLLDSQCNGTICVCREGLYTLKIADSYNCVPGDPAKVGFTDDNGGLVIALNDRDRMTMTANGTEGTSPSDVQNDGNDVNGDHMHQMDGQQPKASSATPNRTRITQWLWMTMSLLILFF